MPWCDLRRVYCLRRKHIRRQEHKFSLMLTKTQRKSCKHADTDFLKSFKQRNTRQRNGWLHTNRFENVQWKLKRMKRVSQEGQCSSFYLKIKSFPLFPCSKKRFHHVPCLWFVSLFLYCQWRAKYALFPCSLKSSGSGRPSMNWDLRVTCNEKFKIGMSYEYEVIPRSVIGFIGLEFLWFTCFWVTSVYRRPPKYP